MTQTPNGKAQSTLASQASPSAVGEGHDFETQQIMIADPRKFIVTHMYKVKRDGWQRVDSYQCESAESAQILLEMLTRSLSSQAPKPASAGGECHGLDTPDAVFFYEQDFYVLSNFSAFNLEWKGRRYDTSEAAYHSEKFPHYSAIRLRIQNAASAHEAFKIAELNKALRRPDWDLVKFNIMRDILRAKVEQHEYVRRKLLATGDRTLIENSWRDDVWGWGPNRDGQNMLGKLWMEIRAELQAIAAEADTANEPFDEGKAMRDADGMDGCPLCSGTGMVLEEVADSFNHSAPDHLAPIEARGAVTDAEIKRLGR